MTSKAAASARDPIASLYGELRGALLAYLRKHTGDAQAAEDLAGVAAQHAVDGGAVCPGLLEVGAGAARHIEACQLMAEWRP